MADTGDDLRATSESIAADADRLRSIEQRKAALADGDPEVIALSEEAERIARRLVPKTVAERELASEATAEAHEDAGRAADPEGDPAA